MKRTLQLMIVAVMAMAFSSCVVDEYYDAPFLGTWEAIRYGEGNFERNIYVDEFHRYVFYSDGTGAYTQSDGLRTRFYWDERGRDAIFIRHDDGLNETMYYYFDRGDLIMSTTPNFVTYFVYR